MSEDVLQLIDKLGYKTASLVGHSMGGKVFMTTALNYVCILWLYLLKGKVCMATTLNYVCILWLQLFKAKHSCNLSKFCMHASVYLRREE